MTIYPAALKAYLSTLPFLGRVSCSHHTLVAGATEEIIINYEVGSAALADGAWLKLVFKFYSDWAAFQTTQPSAPNYVTATYIPRAPFAGETEATVKRLQVRYDQKGHERPFQKAVIIDVVDGYLKPGDRIEIRLGDRRLGGAGTRVQTFAEELFTFRCFVDTAGASRFARVLGDISLRIEAGQAAQLKIITPRLLRAATPGVITLRWEDNWGNLSPRAAVYHDVVVISRAGEKVGSARIDWRREAGWGRAPFFMVQSGDYELTVPGANVRAFISVSATSPTPRALFADLHIHSEDTVGVNNTLYNLTYARDAAGLDVAGYTANDFNVRADRWADAVRICRELHAPGTFLCFPGTEWCGSSAVGGDRNVVFLGDEVRFPLDAEGKSLRVFDWNEDTAKTKGQEAGLWPASALHDAYRDLGDGVLMIPHVGGRRAIFDWHDSQLERLVEIVSSWGHFDWFYRDALARGLKVGASAAGDEHRGRPGGGAPGVGSFGVHGGITGFLCEELTSSAVAKALRSRHTWATTGERNVAFLRSGSAQQGDELHVVGATPLAVHYALWGNTGWERIELRDDQGNVLHARDFDAELGYSSQRIRVRWGGARIKDRYRWAEWHASIQISGTKVASWKSAGLEHSEERVEMIGQQQVQIRTDTFGDADSIELELGELAAATLTLHFEVDSYNKTGSAAERHRDPVIVPLCATVTGADILAKNRVDWQMGGVELFVAVERLTDALLPLQVEEDVMLELKSGPHSHRAIYLFARERDDAKVWTSPIFVTSS